VTDDRWRRKINGKKHFRDGKLKTESARIQRANNNLLVLRNNLAIV
jgi:hypothetical protein